mgnify:FL=1|jgi:hypothetical protein
MTKKIGFRHYQEDDDAKKQDKQERQTAIADFLRQNYAPIGPTSQKVYKTTAELQYDLQNIIDVPANELARQLTEARFAIEYVCGQPFWVLYEKI